MTTSASLLAEFGAATQSTLQRWTNKCTAEERLRNSSMLPEGKAKVQYCPKDGAYVLLEPESKLVRFSSSHIVHFRNCSAVVRNRKQYLVCHEMVNCGCCDMILMEGGVIGCESTVHLDPLCTHIKPYGEGMRQLRACKSCLNIPKLQWGCCDVFVSVTAVQREFKRSFVIFQFLPCFASCFGASNRMQGWKSHLQEGTHGESTSLIVSRP